MGTEEVTQIANSPNGFLIASLCVNVVLALALAYIYKSKEKIVEKFLDYVIKQNEFLNYEKKD